MDDPSSRELGQIIRVEAPRRWCAMSVAGTQLGAMMITFSGSPRDASAMKRTPASAGDVGDLVRVGDDRGHAARHDGRGELRRQAQAALDVDVGVDRPGAMSAAVPDRSCSCAV